jgi:hypothetical protein
LVLERADNTNTEATVFITTHDNRRQNFQHRYKEAIYPRSTIFAARQAYVTLS